MRKINNVFVIDTNTLISAFILPNSITRKAVNKARKLGRVVVSKSTANEFVDTFIRPKFDRYLPLEVRIDIIDEFISLAIFVEPINKIFASRDPKDDQFLELAVAANATCIVSGDKDLLVLHPFRNIPIVSAYDFLNLEL